MGFVKDVVGSITGESGAEAAKKAGRIQAAGTERGIGEVEAAREAGLGFLQPFQQVGAQGLEGAGFLTDPAAQFEFLQQNPLFQMALEQAGTETKGLAAARGRLSAGDTLQQLSKNVLLAAQPLIGGQKQSIMDLLQLGTGVAGGQAGIATGAGRDITDLITGGAASRAAGEVGAEQARSQGFQNLISTGLTAGALFSDKRLKSDIRLIGTINGHNFYSWAWNSVAKALFGLTGRNFGVIAQEVQEINPEAVTEDQGYLKVYYNLIGVPHGGSA